MKASDTLGLIRDIRDGLLRLKQAPAETAIANSLPSIAPVINSMADLGGDRHVVAFLSAFEQVLGRVRNAELRPKADLIALLLICCEHASRMLDQLAHRNEIYFGDLKRSHGLIRQLRAYQRHRFEHAAA
ncbi:MAG: hypothetical protein WBM09_12505 [Gallionella sp.]